MVVKLVSGSGDVGGSFIVGRNLDSVDQALGQAGGGDVLPGGAVVAGDVHEPVVATGPDHAFFMGRFQDIGEGTIVLGAHGFVGIGATAFALLFFFVAGEVGGDFLPGFAHVLGFQQDLGAVVEGTRLVFGPDDGCIPVVAVFHVLGVHAQVLDGGGHDVGTGAGFGVQHFNGTLVAAAHDVAGVVGIEGQESAFAACGSGPGSGGDAAATQFAAGDGEGGIVLLPGVDMVGELVIDVDAVKLCGGHVALGRPGFAEVDGDGSAAVVGDDHIFGVVGVNPQVVVIAVGAVKVLPGFASVERAQGGRAEDVNGVVVFGVGKQFDVVPGALDEAVVVGHARPAFAGVVRNKQAAEFFVGVAFDEGVNAVGVGAAHGDRHFTHFFGQTGFHFVPGLAAIDGFIEPAAGAAADHFPGQAAVFPHCGVEHAGVVHVHRQFDTAGLVADIQDFSPGLAAVGGFIDAAFGGFAIQGALGGYEHRVGVFGVDGDAGNMLGAFQPHFLPGFAGVGRFIYPIPVVGHDAPGRMLAHAHVNDVGIAFRHSDGAHRAGGKKAVGDVFPGEAHIGGFPHAASGGAHVVGGDIANDAGGGHGAAAAEWADAAPFHRLEQGVVIGRSRGGRRRGWSGSGGFLVALGFSRNEQGSCKEDEKDFFSHKR